MCTASNFLLCPCHVRNLQEACSPPYRAPHTPRMRRLACIGDWRIEVLALHGANRTRDVAVAWVRDTLQGGGKAEQECVPVSHGQRPGGGKDRGNLTVGRSEPNRWWQE